MSMCNVIGVLEDDEHQLWSTFDAAVRLADAENARLTLAKTCEASKSFIWMSPFACGGAYLPQTFDSTSEACRLLALAAELVPAWIPVTTLLLGADTRKCLSDFLSKYPCDALITGPRLIARRRALRRDLKRLEVSVITVEPRVREVATQRLTPTVAQPAPATG